MSSKLFAAGILSVGAAFSGVANASLTPLNSWVGNVGYSSDGWGSTTQSGIISAFVPNGSTVLAAYLYTSAFEDTSATQSGTLNGAPITFNSLGVNASSCCSLTASRADVTSIVAPVINSGSGGQYDFRVSENKSSQDGEALVVVYSHPSLATATFALLDGFSAVTGDTATITFANALDPSSPGFQAEMFLGIGFSCCNQQSTVSVNGTTITNTAGNYDDGNAASNGSLITVGGFDDPFSPLLPTYGNDHERYNLKPYINVGDTSIKINTLNPSRDDNIFLAGFYVTGEANVCTTNCNAVPEPDSIALFGLGFAGLGFVRRRKA